eukprot:scaffold5318_cov102-Isochrysis_galbana.AAC.3
MRNAGAKSSGSSRRCRERCHSDAALASVPGVPRLGLGLRRPDRPTDPLTPHPSVPPPMTITRGEIRRGRNRRKER